MFIEQPPQFIRLLYPKAFWRMDKTERAVYLTFELPGYLIYWTNMELKLPSSWWAIM